MINSMISDYSDYSEVSITKPETLENMAKESNFIKVNIEAYNYVQSGDYQSAIESYQECLSLAKELKDDYKINEALNNYATSLFYGGNNKIAIEHFEEGYQSSLNLYSQKSISTIHHLQLLMKLSANLTLAYIAINKTSQALTVFNKVLEIINKEISIQKQITMLKTVIYVFFRTESIISIDDYKNEKIEMDELDSNDQAIHSRVINKIILCFHNYLRSNNIDAWIQCLSEESEHLKQFKDFNGLIFVIFNQYASIYTKCSNSKDVQGANTAKNKVGALLKAVQQNGNNNNADRGHGNEALSTEEALKNLKERIDTAMEIYKYIYSKEKDLKNHLATGEQQRNSYDTNSYRNSNTNSNKRDSAQNSSFFVRLLLKYAITNIENQITDDDMREQMRSQIQMTLELIDKKEIDLSGMKLSMLDPSIAKSLRILFENLIYIYGKSQKKKALIRMKRITRKLKLMEGGKRIKDFFEDYYIGIFNGDTLTKINMNTTGKKEHFYRLDYERDVFQIFTKESNTTPKKQVPFASIKKIVYGMQTNNLKRKIKNMSTSIQPWLFMSIILKDRTIDLHFGKHLFKWFYGLRYYLDQSKMKHKMISTTGFVLGRMKMMMAYKVSVKDSSQSFIKMFLKFHKKV